MVCGVFDERETPHTIKIAAQACTHRLIWGTTESELNMYRLFPLRNLDSPSPTTSYAAALTRLQHLQAAEETLSDGTVRPDCMTQLLDHGDMTEHAIVLIHGFTNCPHQFQQLAPHLHAQGYNILLPRLPRHGYTDRMTDSMAKLTLMELVEVVMEAVDIAHGLGHKVSVLGFSLGGILAAWLAQQRAGLHHVILISPALGIQALSARRRWVAAHLLEILPNFFQWWNPEVKEKATQPAHVYPRFSSRGLAALLRLGLTVVAAAQKNRPGTQSITVIDNPADPVIDHDVIASLVNQWRAHGATVMTHAFPAEWELIHDLIDPLQPDEQVGRVYPLLVDWIVQGVESDVSVNL